MRKKNYFIKTLFIFLTVFSLVKLYDHAINLETFQYGEWLINYQHGFVRRGLIGEIIYLFSLVPGNNLQISFYLILSLICLFYYILSYYFIRDIKFNFIYYLIIFSPLFYLFFVIISKVGIRKEIILYIFYLLFLIHLSSKNFSLNKNWIFIFSYPLLLLNHEGSFFFLPYMVLPLFFLIKKKDLKKLLLQILTLFILSCLIMIFIYFNKGSYEHTKHICDSLGSFAPNKCDWWGPIAALNKELLRDLNNEPMMFFYLKASFISWLGFFSYILYSFVPLVIYFYLSNKIDTYYIKNKELFILLYLITLGFSLPLFHITEDWSRWFSIHFHLLAFLVFFFQRVGISNYANNLTFIKLNNFFIGKKIKSFFIVLLFFYSTLLHHTHFFFEGVKLEFTYYKIFEKIKKK